MWGAEDYHFPCLECLVLSYVALKEIPMSFSEILTLSRIELSGVKDSVWKSAREISEEREQLGYEPLQIIDDFAEHITPWDCPHLEELMGVASYHKTRKEVGIMNTCGYNGSCCQEFF